MFSKEFINDCIERTLYTMAECLLASMAGTSMITELNWKIVAVTTVTSGLVTFLKCILSYAENKYE